MLDFKLDELKVGDDAILEDSNGDMVLVKITKETKTQLVAGDKRFHKKDGYQVGSSNSWSRLSKIYSVTPERMLRVEEYKAFQYRERLVRAIVKFRLDLLPKDILEQVYLLIKNNLPSKENND
jgi:hypothetical protein